MEYWAADFLSLQGLALGRVFTSSGGIPTDFLVTSKGYQEDEGGRDSCSSGLALPGVKRGVGLACQRSLAATESSRFGLPKAGFATRSRVLTQVEFSRNMVSTINGEIVLPSFCLLPIRSFERALYTLDLVRALRRYIFRMASFLKTKLYSLFFFASTWVAKAISAWAKILRRGILNSGSPDKLAELADQIGHAGKYILAASLDAAGFSARASSNIVKAWILLPKGASLRFRRTKETIFQTLSQLETKRPDPQTPLGLVPTGSVLSDESPPLGSLSREAYLHIPVCARHQRCIPFAILDNHYQFTALPFGLASAPRVFTKVMAAVMAILRSRGILIIPYLDDLLIKGSFRRDCAQSLQVTLDILTPLGWIINQEKSTLTPSQHLTILSMEFDMNLVRVFLPNDKFSVLCKGVQSLRHPVPLPFRFCMRVLGKMIASMEAVPFAQFHTHSLQLFLLPTCNKSTTSMDRPVRLPLQDRKKDRGDSGNPNSARLAKASLVCGTGEHSLGNFLEASRPSRSSLARSPLPPEFSVFEFNGMAVDAAVLRELGFSHQVIQTMIRARKPASSLIYHRYWKAFFRWCEENGWDINLDYTQKQVVLIDSLLTVDGGNSTHVGARKHNRDIAEVAAAAELLLPRGNSRISGPVKTSPPPLLHGRLRDYQMIGLNWLARQYKKNLNGILADEAGLGKNVQVIALLAHLASSEGVWGPHLIVARSCNVLKWELELKRWCPSLKLLLYFGSQRELRRKRQSWEEPNNFHVCITSYKQLFKGLQVFMKMRWKYLVLDEVHQLRNMNEKHWDAILNLPRLYLYG
ncbi:unnamed protein product [Ranitomeya imitator]|uniref:ribonuclease H n=1 Tax=Ranitomeya imitator TaxID=111125 RepID=A0ABN9LLE2_9NEOB|nr:unnamed protein product [Ranitomeya imitator]